MYRQMILQDAVYNKNFYLIPAYTHTYPQNQ